MTNTWDKFNERTKNNPPRHLYKKAVEYVTVPNPHALDIAAGALNDTQDMLQRGFTVDALDANPSVMGIAIEIDDPNLTAHVSTMEDFDYGTERYDFISAMFALPFINPEKFGETMERIKTSLKPGGIITYQLFGVKHSFSRNKQMTFVTKEQAV